MHLDIQCGFRGKSRPKWVAREEFREGISSLNLEYPGGFREKNRPKWVTRDGSRGYFYAAFWIPDRDIKEGGRLMANTIDNRRALTVIGVIADGDMLARKIELLLGQGYTTLRVSDDDDKRCDVIARAVSSGGATRSVTLSQGGSHITLPYPFSFKEFREKIEAIMSGISAIRRRLLIESDSRHIVLDGERIRLTESEHKLLSLIAEGEGELVSREELTRGTFGEDADGGILNVYIHYLREKLEGTGEKIILSSRRGGYRIDKKYLGGEI